MLHLYGTREDTKIWAKIISYPSTNCRKIRQRTPKKAHISPNLRSSTIKKGVVRIQVSRECERESLETITITKLGPQRFCKGDIILPASLLQEERQEATNP